MALVFATALHAASPASEGGSHADAAFISLIAQARGGVGPELDPTPTIYSTQDPASVTIDRGMRTKPPTPTAPLPTPLPSPVAIDPDATPLAAPPATVQTGPTVRVAQPVPINGSIVWPVDGGTITQYYSAEHLALDIAAPAGVTVKAAQGGTVTWSGWRNNGGGYVISIDHGGGVQTVYNHLGSLWVRAGQSVAAGQPIAANGCTGTCTGPHVHFEVINNGFIDNPLRYS